MQRVAFVVLAHDDVTQLGRLVNDLRPYPVHLHLDRSAPVAPFVELLREAPTLHANPERVCVHWGGFSILRAMMSTLGHALDHGEPAEQYVFLSGHCLAMRPVSEFVEHLDATPPVHARAFALRPGGEIGQSLDRVERRHFFDTFLGHLSKRSPYVVGGLRRRLAYPAGRPFRPTVPDYVHTCGSNWMVLPHQLAVEVVAAFRRGDFDYLRDSYCGDEIAVSTYIYRHPHWAEQTQRGGLEDPPVGADLSWMPNFHHLRRGLDGYLDPDDVERARLGGQYFARKVRS